jgi:hypothetical protein
MQAIHTDIIINASAEKVWSILTDFAKYPEWNPFVVSIKGKPELGATLTVVLRNGTGTSVFRPTVVSALPNEAFAWKGSLPLGIFRGHHQFRIHRILDKQVRFTHSEEFTGLLSGLIMKQIGKTTEEGFRAMNQALKERAERG